MKAWVVNEQQGIVIGVCDDIPDAELLIEMLEVVDPVNVHAGHYGIAADEEAETAYQQPSCVVRLSNRVDEALKYLHELKQDHYIAIERIEKLLRAAVVLVRAQPVADPVREAEIELADMKQNGNADDVLAAQINLENVRHEAKHAPPRRTQ